MPLAACDIFDASTWYIIFAVGWGSPAVAIITRALRERRVPAASVVCSFYFYLLVMGLWFSWTDSALSVFLILGTLLAGPVIAILTLSMGWSWQRRERPGFPVIQSQESDKYSNGDYPTAASG